LLTGATTLFPITFRKETAVPFISRIRSVRTTLANRRTERIAHRQLSAELASFQTPSERAELDHLIARHTAAETQEIRAIINRQDYERQRRTSAVGGHRA
jgi:hypothetical protein